MGALLLRWLAFTAALGLTLLPAALGLSVMPGLAESPRLFGPAWSWWLMALAPGGFTRVQFDGAVWLADAGPAVALTAWAVAGLVWAVALRRVRLPVFLLLAVPLVLATGLGASYLLSLLGYSAYAYF